MPWCPNCKNEYTNGHSLCTDCSIPLVEVLENRKELRIVLSAGEEIANRFVDFLDYSAIHTAVTEYDPVSELYHVSVPASVAEHSEKLAKIFKKEQLEEILQAQTPDEQSAKTAKAFVASNEKLKDLRSSAYTLLLVGVAGLVVVLLCFLGVLDFNLASHMKYLTYGVMGVLFLVFIYFGISSYKQANVTAAQAKKENELTSEIMQWFKKSIETSVLNAEVADDMKPEVIYFKRCEAMRQVIKEAYGNLDEDYVDNLIEELYQELFE